MRVQFATLGTSTDVVLNALRHVPMDELHVFTDDEEAIEVIELQKFYSNKPLNIPVHPHAIDKFDIMDCMLTIINTIRSVEKKYVREHTDFEITINMTGGTKIMISAILLAGYMTGNRVFYIKKKREDKGIGELIWVPTPRVSPSNIKKMKYEMLKELGNIDRPISLTNLTKQVGAKSSQALTRYIKFFEEEKLIISDYKGKERLISLTNTGRVLYALLETD